MDFCLLLQIMGENIGKYMSKNLSGKYSWKLLHHAKKYATDALKTSSKQVIQKTPEATGDLIGNKIANKITKLQKIYNKIIQRQLQMSMIKKYLNKYVSPEERQETIDEIILK